MARRRSKLTPSKEAKARVKFRERVAKRMRKAMDKGQLSMGFKIGIFQARIVKYGMVHEATAHFMRDAVASARQQQHNLLNVWNIGMIRGQDWFKLALKSAVAHADLIKDNILAIPLVDTGRLVKSIDVRRQGKGRKGRKR